MDAKPGALAGGPQTRCAIQVRALDAKRKDPAKLPGL
jgi:hypothetical protein